MDRWTELMSMYGGINENISIDNLINLMKDAIRDVDVEKWISGTSVGKHGPERMVISYPKINTIFTINEVSDKTIKQTAFIALMNPENIKRLLDEIDRLNGMRGC